MFWFVRKRWGKKKYEGVHKYRRKTKMLVLLEARTDKLLKHSVAIIIISLRNFRSFTHSKNYIYWSWIILNANHNSCQVWAGRRHVFFSITQCFFFFNKLLHFWYLSIHIWVVHKIINIVFPSKPQNLFNYTALMQRWERHELITCKNVWKYL